MGLSNLKAKVIVVFNAGYRVDSDGTVYSPTGRTLKTAMNSDGYLTFGAKLGREAKGKTGTVLIHQLVAWQKFGVKLLDKGIVVRHLNNNKVDNSFDNIELGSKSDNATDAVVRPFGVRPMTPEQVLEIRRLYKLGKPVSHIAKEFKISRSTVRGIAVGKTYKNVESSPQEDSAPL